MKNFKSILPLGEHFLNESEVKFTRKIKKIPLEDITIGDAGEINYCQVGRLMEDQPQSNPRILNELLSIPILKLFKSSKAKEFLVNILKRFPQIIEEVNLIFLRRFICRPYRY